MGRGFEINPYGVLETKVCGFIFLRAKYHAENGRFDFAQWEYQGHFITKILSSMTGQGIINKSYFVGELLFESSTAHDEHRGLHGAIIPACIRGPFKVRINSRINRI